jgi:hypothetical protein
MYILTNDSSDRLIKYNTIRDLYYNQFITIIKNLDFELFSITLKEYEIYDYLDSDGFIIGTVRDNKICDDEIDLLTDNELVLVLNRCLLNGFSINC